MLCGTLQNLIWVYTVCLLIVFVFNIPTTTKVVWRLGHRLVSANRLQKQGIEPGYHWPRRHVLYSLHHEGSWITSQAVRIYKDGTLSKCVVSPGQCSSQYIWARTWDFQQCGRSDQQSFRSACYQSLCYSLEYSMNVKLQTEQHLEFLSLKEGCRGSYESSHVKIPHNVSPLLLRSNT